MLTNVVDYIEGNEDDNCMNLHHSSSMSAVVGYLRGFLPTWKDILRQFIQFDQRCITR